MKVFIETERLILREILLTDVEGMFELDADPEVHEYLGKNPISSREQVLSVIEFIRKQYVEYGIGRWAVIDRRTDQFVGWAGLKFVTELTNNHIDYYDLGYRIIRKYWGQGFATEAAFESVRYAFDTLKVEQVYAMVDCKNDRSNSVLRKAGLSLVEKFELEGIEHNWYRVNRNDFCSAKPLTNG